MNRVAIAKVAMIANAVIWGLIWWPLRRLEASGVHPLFATAAGYLVGAIAVTFVRRHAWFELSTSRSLWLIGLVSGLSNAAFNWAVTAGNVARVVFLFYLMPIWAVLLARWLLKEQLTRKATACLAVALTGSVVVLWPDGGTGARGMPREDLLAVGSGFLFALSNVLLRRERQDETASARTLALFTGGWLVPGVLGVLGVLFGSMHTTQPIMAPLGVVAHLALLSALLIASTVALQYGAANLPAAATACIMLLEVAVASLSSCAADASSFSLRLAIGGALIFAAATGMVTVPSDESRGGETTGEALPKA